MIEMLERMERGENWRGGSAPLDPQAATFTIAPPMRCSRGRPWL